MKIYKYILVSAIISISVASTATTPDSNPSATEIQEGIKSKASGDKNEQPAQENPAPAAKSNENKSKKDEPKNEEAKEVEEALTSECQLIKDWEKSNSIFTQYQEYIKFSKKFKAEEVQDYRTSCEDLKTTIDAINNKTASTPVKFDIKKWWETTKELKKDFKNANIKQEDIDKWYSICESIYDKYNKVVKEYNKTENIPAVNNEATAATETPSTPKEDVYTTIYQLQDSIYILKGELNSLTKDYNELKGKEALYNEAIRKDSTYSASLNDAFRVCVFFPLAVKYNKLYVDYAYNAAEKMVKGQNGLPKELIVQWNKFSPLLNGYGDYNQDVINYIKSVQKKVKTKQNKITATDVEFYKGRIDYDMPKYSIYYNKDVSIKYLDNVLNEFFSLLEGYEGREIPDRVFTNFILNNLDSEYEPE